MYPKYETLQALRARSNSDVQLQRIIRGYIRSLGKTMNQGNRNPEDLENMSQAMATRSKQSKDLRSAHLIKGFLRRKPYKVCEQKIKPSTIDPIKLMEQTEFLSRYGVSSFEFNQWLTTEL